MSEQSIIITTTSLCSSCDVMNKPSLSSDSSIDSGCNLSTSESIVSNNHLVSMSTQNDSNSCMSNTRHGGIRSNMLMLPPQPNVPPPPPPPPPPQLQEDFYSTTDVYDNRTSIYQQFSNNNLTSNQTICTENASNIYATFNNNVARARSSNTDSNCAKQSPSIVSKDQQLQSQNPSPQSNTFQQTVINQRSSTSSLESANSAPLMPMNVKGMLLHGVSSEEVLRNWLSSIKCEEYIENFIYHGYDVHLVTRMTPQDLAAIGCKTPALRKKLLTEIRKLNLDYEIPECDLKSTHLIKWLESLKLNSYFNTFIAEGYDTVEKACQLTWEDLEEIGMCKLGHQKRFLLAIDKITKLAKKQEEIQNDSAIYDVHPNHRVSLGALPENRVGTIGRVRSGLFQTRSGANLDHRGLPVATILPALVHINTPAISSDLNNKSSNIQLSHSKGIHCNNIVVSENESQVYDRMESFTLNDLGSTIKKNPPLPPVRTNSLRDSQNGLMNDQPVYNSTGSNTINSTSFLRTPKLGTLTATTNKMLSSGGHIKTLSGDQVSTSRSILSPVREAPLPPTQMRQNNFSDKVIKESSTIIQAQNDYSVAVNSNGMTFMNNPQFASSDEFPPPPPPQCQ